MNLCGSQYDPKEDDELHALVASRRGTSQKSSASNSLCGPAEKDTESIIYSDDDEGTKGSFLDSLVGEALLDDDSQIDDDRPLDNSGQGIFTGHRLLTGVAGRSKPTSNTQHQSKRNGSATYNSWNYALDEFSPSRSLAYMNPRSDTLQSTIDSVSQDQTHRRTVEDLVSPPLEAQSSFEDMVKRLDGGFRVKLHFTDSIGGTEDVLLFMDEENRSIYMRLFILDDKIDEQGCWQEIPIDDVRRVEVGGSHLGSVGKSGPSWGGTAFTMVVNQDSHIVYYDFEAESHMESEVIVSTLMGFMDRKKQSSYGMRKTFTDVEHMAMNGNFTSSKNGSNSGGDLSKVCEVDGPEVQCLTSNVACADFSVLQEQLPPHDAVSSATICLSDTMERQKIADIDCIDENISCVDVRQVEDERSDDRGGGSEARDDMERDPDTSARYHISNKIGYGGTLDQPIPCSPSLEEQMQQTNGSNGSEDSKREAAASKPNTDLVDQLEGFFGPQDNLCSRKLLLGSSEDDILYVNEVEGRKPAPSMSFDDLPIGDDHLRASEIRHNSSLRLPSRDAPTPEGIHSKKSLRTSTDIELGCSMTSESDVPILGKTEDLVVDLVASGNLGGNWCADDTCTNAFNDIAKTCTGIFALKQRQAQKFSMTGGCVIPEGLEEQQRIVEEYIAAAIGAPSDFYTYMTENDPWQQGDKDSTKEHKDHATSKIRNRASIRNAQARRMEKLQSEMTFATALKKSQEQASFVQTTQSFDDAGIYRNKSMNGKAVKVAKEFHTSALLKHVVGHMVSAEQLPEEQVEYYDSDPEDTREQSLRRKGPRRVVAEIKSQEESETLPVSTFRRKNSPLDKVMSSKKVSKKLDEETIIEIVQSIINERMTLLWHPSPQNQNSGQNTSPMCAKVWIESGVCLMDGTYVLPKLSWSKVTRPYISYEDESVDAWQERSLKQDLSPFKLDLLDICRIYAARNIDREKNPFADARKSFYVETQSESFLFEAIDVAERDRIVFALKLCVARLASLLMLRDPRAAEEFFGSTQVPGAPPEWLQQEKAGQMLPPVNE